MLNVTGYSAKLLLLCSALEAMAKSPINNFGKKQKYQFLTEVLGEDLKDKIFQQKVGIRHRLIHGEYFDEETDKYNYLKEIYEKIINYFNDKVFNQNLIKNVTHPQRHPDNNKEGGYYFIQQTDESPAFDLKTLINNCNEDLDILTDKFDLISESDISSPY